VAQLAQSQTSEEGPSWRPVYVGLVGLGVGLLIVLVRRGRRRVTSRLVPSLGRAATSSGKFARSLAPLVLVPVGAVSTVARWRPSRPEVVDRLSREETAVAEPEQEQEQEQEEELLPPPLPPPREPVVEVPLRDEAPAQALKPDGGGFVDGRSSSPAPAPPESPPVAPREEVQRRTLRFAEPLATTWERCEIEWWRGYVKSDFYAVAFRPTGEWYVAERSPSFRWRQSEPPQEGEAGREEHAHLAGRLVADGWEPVGNGPVWYQKRFRRLVPPSLGELAGVLGPQGTGAES
jgi:hypothetical protein